MPQYQGHWVTNKFLVKDQTEFRTWAELWPDANYIPHRDKHAELRARPDWGAIPQHKLVDGAWIEGNFLEELSAHIDPTSVCLLVQSGTDGSKVVDGYAYGLTGGDKAYVDRVVEFTLLDIEDLAKRKFGLKPTSIY